MRKISSEDVRMRPGCNSLIVVLFCLLLMEHFFHLSSHSQEGDYGVGLTHRSKEWQELWLEEHGRRFCLYKARRDKGKKKGHRPGSSAAIQSRRKIACRAILRNIRPDAKTILGTTVAELGISQDATSDELSWNKKLKDFQNLTDRKKTAAKHQQNQRARRCPAYEKPEPARGNIFPKKRACATSQMLPLEHPALIDACKKKPDLAGFKGKVHRLQDLSARGLAKILACETCIIVSEKALPMGGKVAGNHKYDTATVKLLLGLVALGGAICQVSDLSRRDRMVQFRPALFACDKNITVTANFQLKYSMLVDMLDFLCQMTGSKWTYDRQESDQAIRPAERKFSWASATDVVLDGATHMVQFLGAAARLDSKGVKRYLPDSTQR